MGEARSIDPRRVKRAFDRAAEGYDRAAVVQREIAHRLLERLQWVKLEPACALDLGSGTGAVARDLCVRYPRTRVIALDTSFRMLKAYDADASLWKRLRGKSDYERVVGAMERMPFASECLDLVCSNLALEWSGQPDEVFGEVHRCLQTDGLFMFTTLGPDTLKELRAASPDASIQPMVDMHNVGDALLQAGFCNPVMDMELITVTYSGVSALFEDLRATGSGSAAARVHKGLRGRAWLQALSRNYERLRVEGRLPATVEVIYGHCWKAYPPHRADARNTQAVVNFHPRRRDA